MKIKHQTKSGPGRIHSKVKPDARRADKSFAASNGVPETLRRYAKRYGIDAGTVVQTRTQADALIASRAEA